MKQLLAFTEKERTVIEREHTQLEAQQARWCLILQTIAECNGLKGSVALASDRSGFVSVEQVPDKPAAPLDDFAKRLASASEPITDAKLFGEQ